MPAAAANLRDRRRQSRPLSRLRRTNDRALAQRGAGDHDPAPNATVDAPGIFPTGHATAVGNSTIAREAAGRAAVERPGEFRHATDRCGFSFATARWFRRCRWKPRGNGPGAECSSPSADAPVAFATASSGAARTANSPAQILFNRITAEIRKVFVGQEELVLGTLVALFSSGHVLIESVPGLGKTLFVRTLGPSLGLRLRPHPIHRRSHALRHHRRADLRS